MAILLQDPRKANGSEEEVPSADSSSNTEGGQSLQDRCGRDFLGSLKYIAAVREGTEAGRVYAEDQRRQGKSVSVKELQKVQQEAANKLCPKKE